MINKQDFDFTGFRELLAGSESSKSYSSVYYGNPNAYGRYQFIPNTIERVANYLGLSTPSPESFLNNPALQDQFFAGYANIILDYINANGLYNFIGNSITSHYGVRNIIDEYGLVAGAWLGGEGGLQNYLTLGIDKKDALGTYISDYIVKFSGRDLKKKSLPNCRASILGILEEIEIKFSDIKNLLNEN